jgi:hypothetical protein
MNDYSLEFFEKEEELAGKKATKKFIRLNYKGEPIGQISYQMIGDTLKIWNRVTYGNHQQRKSSNVKFGNESFNHDSRSIGEELIIQAVAREKAKNITTPHKTASAKASKERLFKKHGITVGYLKPKSITRKVTPLINRRRPR